MRVMKVKSSELYLKDTYLNKSSDLLTNKTIIEYDLKSANTSLCREYKLLPDDQIDKIEKKRKKDRVRTIGKIQRKDKKFKEGLKVAFVDIRKRFFEANDIHDEDILAIKKDAIFCLKRCDNTHFGHCEFISKNEYSSYMYLNRLEFYYDGRNNFIDVKGIDDEVLMRHEDFMLKFFKTLFRHLESSDDITVMKFYKRFVDKYKRLQLEVGYYREFNQESVIKLADSEETYTDEVFIPYEHKHEHLSIDYNFFNILIPILQIII